MPDSTFDYTNSNLPLTSGGTVFYQPESEYHFPVPPDGGFIYCNVDDNNHVDRNKPLYPPIKKQKSLTIEDLAEIFIMNCKDPLLEWKLSQYNGDPLHWHEWFGQFESANDSTRLSDDVKLTYLKTLVTGKAKNAIAEFAYSLVMYKDALNTLIRKFGGPQTIANAHLDKLSCLQPLKMHNYDSIISLASTISNLIGVFKSLSYTKDLEGIALLNQALGKLPPNLKETWALHTVKRSLYQPSLIHSNDWLAEKVEAHWRMRANAPKSRNQ